MTTEFLANLEPQVKKWRQDLHRIPEVGLAEFKTAAYIRAELDKMGLKWEEICTTGTTVYLDNQKNSTIAFRTDIDALPVNEESGCEYSSTHPGFMHACGHDGHIANLLGFAAWAKNNVETLNHNLLLIFQPAEETVGGAKEIVQSGIFDKYNVEKIYGLHLSPDLPEGVLGSRPGPFMAQTGEVHITIEGKGAHAALANEGIDSLYIASQLIQQYQGIITRRIPPMAPAVLHIGKMIAGEAGNVVAPSATMVGTIRTFSRPLFLEIAEHMKTLHEGAERIYGCKIEMIADPGYPPVLNDITLTKQMVDIFQKAGFSYHEFSEPYFLGEDFSYYQEKVPGVFIFLGVRNEEKAHIYGLHNNKFNFDESVLITGIQSFIALAKR